VDSTFASFASSNGMVNESEVKPSQMIMVRSLLCASAGALPITGPRAEVRPIAAKSLLISRRVIFPDR
jgi:hypothetical protein